MTLALTFVLCLPPRLGALRRAGHPRPRARRPARHRLGQHRRHQRAAHRQQGRGGGDAPPRRRQGRGGGAARAGAGGRDGGAGRGLRGLPRPPLPGLARVPRRQGGRDLPRHDAGAGLAGGARRLPDLAGGRLRLPLLLARGAGRGGLDAALALGSSAAPTRSGSGWRWRRWSSSATTPTSGGCSPGRSRGSARASRAVPSSFSGQDGEIRLVQSMYIPGTSWVPPARAARADPGGGFSTLAGIELADGGAQPRPPTAMRRSASASRAKSDPIHASSRRAAPPERRPRTCEVGGAQGEDRGRPAGDLGVEVGRQRRPERRRPDSAASSAASAPWR